jgi:hypothetical protein
MAPGTATPRLARTTGDEGAHRAHHAEEGKEADSFWGTTALGAVRSSGSPRYIARNGGGVRLVTKIEEGSAQRSPGAEQPRTTMLGIAGARGVDGFGQLGSGSPRHPAHGGASAIFDERRARPAAGNREVSAAATAMHGSAAYRAIT